MQSPMWATSTVLIKPWRTRNSKCQLQHHSTLGKLLTRTDAWKPDMCWARLSCGFGSAQLEWNYTAGFFLLAYDLVVNLTAAATIGFVHAGVCVRSFGSRIFLLSIDSTSIGFGVRPTAGSPSALLSNIRSA